MTTPQNPYAAPGPQQPMSPADEKLWATLTHVGSIFLSILAPLIAYLVLKDRGPFVRGRIIDLTPAAARALGFSGLAPVEVTKVSEG